MPAGVAVAFDAANSRAAFTIPHIITADAIGALASGLEGVGRNPHLKLITIEGAGADFSFGASIPEHAPERIAAVLPAMHALLGDLLDAPAVTAAVVRGRCLGGGFELALACDLIFAADDAVFGLPEIALGVFPPAGAALLPLRAGAGRSSRTILTGESRGVDYWRDAGLIELAAPAASLGSAVDAWFETHLALKSAAALRHAAAAARLPLAASFRRAIPELERLYLDTLMSTHDAAEGVAAFLEKRPPRWTDD